LKHDIHYWNFVFAGLQDITLYFSKQTSFEKEDMNIQSFGTIRILASRFPLRSHEEKWHFNVVPMEGHKIYYKGGGWCLLPKVASRVKLMFEVVFTK
jgi:hypothetical protein